MWLWCYSNNSWGQSDISNTIFAGFHSSQIGLVSWRGLEKPRVQCGCEPCSLPVGSAWIYIAHCFAAESRYYSELSIFSQKGSYYRYRADGASPFVCRPVALVCGPVIELAMLKACAGSHGDFEF